MDRGLRSASVEVVEHWLENDGADYSPTALVEKLYALFLDGREQSGKPKP